MQTIRLRVNNKIYSHLMWFLKRFRNDEIQVINEDSKFMSVQEYMKNELHKLESEEGEMMSLEELDDDLENTIRKYED